MRTQASYGVVIQARASSTRLPGKVLMDVEGKPMLLRQAERLRNGIGDLPLIIATSDESSDDKVEELCTKHGFTCFRGSLDDVMLRFIQCAQKYGIDYIVRVGGDDPLIDPDCCTTLVSMHRKEPCDFMYASNRDGWPYGCAAELISVSSLEKIHSQVDDALYKEHTIPYFFEHQDDFNIVKVLAPESIHRPDYYFTVDFPEDLEFIRSIFSRLLTEGEYFPLQRVISLIDGNSEMRDINKHLHSGFDH